jgi:hypothetical protein
MWHHYAARAAIMIRQLTFALLIAATFFAVPALSASAKDRLQTLVNDTAAQIQIAYRQHPDERDARREWLAAVIAAWRAAPRSEANNERLTTWLHAAISNSMPGSREPLPAMPAFVADVKVESRLVENVEVKKADDNSRAKAEPDPFRDDPTNERE